MSQNLPPFNIVIPIYEAVDLLDVAAPREMFSWMGFYWKEKSVNLRLVARTKRTVTTRDGMRLTPDDTFRGCAASKLQADLIWVPGGDVPGLKKTMRDRAYLGFLKQQSAGAAYVTSVCEGAMLLASAGLLKGHTATTHWAFIPCLKKMGITVAPGHPRYFIDGNRVTGGGVSSGLDEALKLVALISGEDIARRVQLVTQYFPCPPFSGDIPETTDCPLDSAA